MLHTSEIVELRGQVLGAGARVNKSHIGILTPT